MEFLKVVLFPLHVLAGLLGALSSAILRVSGVDHTSRAAQISMILLLGALAWFVLHALLFAAAFLGALPVEMLGLLTMLLPVLLLPCVVIASLRVWAPERGARAGTTPGRASR